MFTYEIAAVGGQGGGPFSHADSKEMVEAGCWLGAGANGMRVSTGLYITLSSMFWWPFSCAVGLAVDCS